MSVSLLFGLHLYWNYTNMDNSSSGWYIFLKFLGDILRTLIYYFQIILIFLCLSVCWLATSLLKLDKYRVISTSRWDIFSKNFGESKEFKIILNFLFVCQFVTSLLKLDKYGDTSIFGLYIFLKFSWDIPWTLVH